MIDYALKLTPEPTLAWQQEIESLGQHGFGEEQVGGPRPHQLHVQIRRSAG
jgi:hypothetical protein